MDTKTIETLDRTVDPNRPIRLPCDCRAGAIAIPTVTNEDPPKTRFGYTIECNACQSRVFLIHDWRKGHATFETVRTC